MADGHPSPMRCWAVLINPDDGVEQIPVVGDPQPWPLMSFTRDALPDLCAAAETLHQQSALATRVVELAMTRVVQEHPS